LSRRWLNGGALIVPNDGGDQTFPESRCDLRLILYLRLETAAALVRSKRPETAAVRETDAFKLDYSPFGRVCIANRQGGFALDCYDARALPSSIEARERRDANWRGARWL
jgi:hypothetical protein